MTHKHRLGTAGYYVVSIVLAVIALIPFLWMISTSLKSRGALMSIPIEWIPAEPTLDGYAKVFSRFPFLRTIGNSLLISVAYTLITLISASMAAFAFAKLRFRGSGAILSVYIATMMIPTQVVFISLYVMMRKWGMLNTYIALWPCRCASPRSRRSPSPPSWRAGTTISGRCSCSRTGTR